MKATELRIGNKVYIDYLDVDTGKWHQQIIEISYRDIYNLINSNHMLKGAYEGIPLTEDWLLRFGFKKDNNEWKLFPCAEIQIIVFNEGVYNGVMFYTRTIHSDYTPIYCNNIINNVHQLQNLYYALTELELTTP